MYIHKCIYIHILYLTVLPLAPPKKNMLLPTAAVAAKPAAGGAVPPTRGESHYKTKQHKLRIAILGDRFFPPFYMNWFIDGL